MDYNQLKATKSILVQAPIAAGSTVCKGSAAVDCANFESCLFSHIIGTMGSTCAVVAKIQDSTSTTAWTDLSGATQSSTADADDKILQIEVAKPRKRYLRSYITRSSTAGGSEYGGTIATLGSPRNLPVVFASSTYATTTGPLLKVSPST